MPPIVTLTMIMATVDAHARPPAVITCGTAAFPPTQLVMVTAPADPIATRPSVTSTERQSAVLSNTRVEALPLTSRSYLPPYRLATGVLRCNKERSVSTTHVFSAQRRSPQ